MFEWKKLLSSKRVRELSGGSPSHRIQGDVRSAFDQDYGRAVFCTPVRRLQDKAQVFPLDPHDSVRTRLTHSLEVSSIARGLGARAERFLQKSDQIRSDEVGSVPTIAATCGLIHDIGNPPFGHAGEKAIASWFQDHAGLFDSFPGANPEQRKASQYAQDFLLFEGNAQTQRLLSSLQMLADEYGLNLTCATLSASLKYVVPSDQRDKSGAASKKHGYFASENDLMRKIQNEVGTGVHRHPIAFLVEAADDIAYATVDLEDGIKKGCLGWTTLREKLEERAGGSLLNSVITNTKSKIPTGTLSGRALDEAMSIAFRTYAIIELSKIAVAQFETHYDAIMSGSYPHSLLEDSPAKEFIGACKSIGLEYVYSFHEILKLELMGSKVLRDLLELYWSGARYIGTDGVPPLSSKVISLISRNYRDICLNNIREAASNGVPLDYYRMQLITDQVCGMTDSFAVKMHKELMNG